MKNKMNKGTSPEDQTLIEQISEAYQPEQRSKQALCDFESTLLARIDAPRSAMRWPIGVAILAATVLFVVGMNLGDKKSKDRETIAKVTNTQAAADVEWVSALLGIESNVDESADLPDEYATIMMMMGDDSDDWNEN